MLKMGYETTNFLLNLGNLSFYFLFTIVLTITLRILIIFQFKTCNRVKECISNYSKKVIYSLILRLYLESYIELALVTFISFKRDVNIKLGGEVTARVFASITMILLILFPIITSFLLLRNKFNMKSTSFKTSFGVLYSDFKTESSYFYCSFFCTKRFVFCYMILSEGDIVIRLFILLAIQEI